MWTDTHCHLAGEEYDADRAEVFARAREAGVTMFVVIGAGDGLEGNHRACALAEKVPDVCVAVGIHPHDAGKVPDHYIEVMQSTLPLTPSGASKIVAIGETGLDYHYDHAPRDVQQKVFREQLDLAKSIQLPVIIHSREAWNDTVRIIQEAGPLPAAGVFHCFSGTPEEMKQALDLGFFISISGIVTFKRAQNLLEVAAQVPLDRLVIETDAPFLAPVPHRGKRNEPAFVALVGEKIAAIRNIDVKEAAVKTTQNARKLFYGIA